MNSHQKRAKRGVGAEVRRVVIVLYWILLLFGAESKAGVDDAVDHLVPINAKEFPAYRAELQKKLLVTPNDIAQMTIRPSWQPEFAVSVYSTRSSSADDARRYNVTVTRASANMQSDTDAVHIVRTDAHLPASTALLVKEVWKRMLLNTRSYESTVSPPVDGAIVEFALSEPDQPPLRGELPVNPSDDIRAFETLGMLLVKYGEARENELNGLAKEIERAAQTLLGKRSRQIDQKMR